VKLRRPIAALAALPLTAGALLLMAGAPAQAADCTASAPAATTAYPPTLCAAIVSASTVDLGGTLKIGGGGFVPGNEVTLTLFSTPVSLGTAVADDSGVVSADVKIPSDTPAGQHHIAIFDSATGRLLTVPITVQGVVATQPSPAAVAQHAVAPATKAESSNYLLPLTGGGVAVVVVAGTSLVLLRRRHAKVAQPAI
jgi:hypothetical protein